MFNGILTKIIKLHIIFAIFKEFLLLCRLFYCILTTSNWKSNISALRNQSARVHHLAQILKSLECLGIKGMLSSSQHRTPKN